MKGDKGMWDWNTISQIATTVLCLATICILIYAALNYSEFVKNVELTAKNIELTAKNIELTHKPIVFIKGTIIPKGESENSMKHVFVIANDLPPINVSPAKLNLQPQKPLGLVVCTPKSCEAGTGYIPSASAL